MAVDRDHVPNGLGSGVTFMAAAQAMWQSESAASQFRQRIFDVLADGLPISVTITDTGGEFDGYGALTGTCGLLRVAMCEAGAVPSDIEIAVKATDILPRTALTIRNEHLGVGIIHVLPDRVVMQPDRSRREHERHQSFWAQCWQARVGGQVQLACGARVVPTCDLLSSEAADCVLPATHVQVPAGTAWAPVYLDAGAFVADDGAIRITTLERALVRGIETGDALHDTTHWPTAQMRHDAWLNRRLAIFVTGFGDIVDRLGLSPGDFECLVEIMSLVRHIKRRLVQCSRKIARNARRLPALDETSPEVNLRGTERGTWRDRWLEAVESNAVRHRNLLVLSPWSVFPQRRRADYRYADLLPLLQCADACSFAGAPDLSHWNCQEFKHFHQRAWAVLQQRSAAIQIAAGP